MTKIKSTDGFPKRIIFKFSILALALYLVFSMISLQSDLVEQRKVLKEKQKQISELRVSNDELKSLLKNGSQKELVERAAREKLDFVYSNEEVYLDRKGN